MVKILFVCRGHTFRSPILAALVKREFEKRGFNIGVESAGTMDREPSPPSEAARMVAAEHGIDLTHHLSRHIREIPNLHDHFLFFCMDKRQDRALLKFGADPNKIAILGVPCPAPYGVDTYREYVQKLHRIAPEIVSDVIEFASKESSC